MEPTRGRITQAVRDDFQLITPDELADRLRVSKDWIYDQVQARKIPYERIGQRLRFNLEDIKAYVSGEWQPEENSDPIEKPEPSRPRKGGRPRKN